MRTRYKSFKSEKIKEKNIEVGDEDEDEVMHPGVNTKEINIVSLEGQKQQHNRNNLNTPQFINNQPLTTNTTQKLDSFAALAMRKKQSPSNLYTNNNCPNKTSTITQTTTAAHEETRIRSTSSLPAVEHQPMAESNPVDIATSNKDDKTKEESTTRRRAFSLQFFKKKNVEEIEQKKLEKNEKKFDLKKKENFSFEDFYVREKSNKLH
ncbi:predicted protein [Naegleria gruberi]|uniref:Predicted protein n=1 Tax=Naegleria gruberi TaxID=5762 RepID=D2V947_NAEGR|nr:uncharacterized protein NAEGRDRAFT_47768 [Naegleria gruberi]EFC46526.1 predicted protein [Naegleria gruberi]|eukprot:XP_002679270.1 predicted protein [Naegleria gruberi strain NEG-M]